MNIYEIFPEIEDLRLFKGVSRETIEKFLVGDSISVCSYEQKVTIHSDENEDTRVGIVLSGIIEISSLNSAHKVLIKTAGRGSIFGIANLYTDSSALPSAISAKTNAQVIMISREAFKSMLESDITLMRNFLAFLGHKIVYLNKKIASYTAGNTEQKVAYFLSENAVDCLVTTDMSYSDIAVMLDIGRASLYRAFDSLEAEKIIERDGKTIKIINRQKLRKIYSE